MPTYRGALETGPGRHRTAVIVVADPLPVGVQGRIFPPGHRKAVTTMVPQTRRMRTASQRRRAKTCPGGHTVGIYWGCHVAAPPRPAPPHRVGGPVRMRPALRVQTMRAVRRRPRQPPHPPTRQHIFIDHPHPIRLPHLPVINNPPTSANKPSTAGNRRATVERE